MYFHLLNSDNPDLNIYEGYFSDPTDPKRDKIIFTRLKYDEISVYTEMEDLGNPLVWQRQDVFILNMADTDELDQFFLEIKKSGFSELNIYKPKQDFFVAYASLFPKSKLFASRKKNSAIEFLLCLIEDIFDAESELNKHNPEKCKIYRNILSQSKVFEYINKKRMFYRSLYNYKQAYNTSRPPKRRDASKPSENFFSELRISYNKYLELLLKYEMTHYISPDIIETGEWFLLDPEKELKELSKIEKEFSIDESSLIKVQNFLLAKHDISGAFKAGNRHFRINPFFLQVFSFAVFLFISISWIFAWQVEVEVLFAVGTLSAFASSFMAVISNKTRHNYDMVLLRLIVSIVSSWLIIIALVDFLKFFINMDAVSYYTLIVVLPLITLLAIFVEVIFSSPYQIRKEKKLILKKVVSVFIYAFNISFIVGLFFSTLIISPFMNDNETLIENKYVKETKLMIENKYIKETKLMIEKDPSTKNKSKSYTDSLRVLKTFFEDKNRIIEHLKINNSEKDIIGIYMSNLKLNSEIDHNEFDKKIIANVLGKEFYFKLFLIHLMLVLAFSIITQAILSKDPITQTI